MYLIQQNSRAARVESLVLYYAAPGRYGIRLSLDGALAAASTTQLAARRVDPFEASDFGPADYQELAGLSQAQAWGAPVFQPGHPRFSHALARMEVLEAKELAAALETVG